jgi:hypothetical protein
MLHTKEKIEIIKIEKDCIDAQLVRSERQLPGKGISKETSLILGGKLRYDVMILTSKKLNISEKSILELPEQTLQLNCAEKDQFVTTQTSTYHVQTGNKFAG